MTLKELYQTIGGDYDQAIKVLRVEKLMDKHIRRMAKNQVIDKLLAAGDSMDPEQLFETSHAVKGVCGNLGLTAIAAAASDISEEFRPGAERKLSDDEVKAKLAEIAALYQKTTDGINLYCNQ